VIGANGVYYSNDNRVEVENPLEPFGTNTADHLRRMYSFPNYPDILVNSFINLEKDEGCAFEEIFFVDDTGAERSCSECC
jgi:hypothetical protein